MKRIYFACLFLCLTTFLLSQSNPVPLVNRTASIGSPASASQGDPETQAAQGVSWPRVRIHQACGTTQLHANRLRPVHRSVFG
jgi:hypothetical protein